MDKRESRRIHRQSRSRRRRQIAKGQDVHRRPLSRFAKEGAILRVAHSVFVRPRTSRFVGAVVPDLHEVVETIARGNCETVQVHGAEASRRFGFST